MLRYILYMESVIKPVILYAEDDQDDFEGLKDALEQLSDKHDLVQAKNGTEVMSYLENGNAFPGLIVLDLNMPIMDGKETLLWLKSREEFKDIPTMVFTTSSRDEDLKLCKSHDCTFFRKPTLYRDLLHIVQLMLQMSSTKSTSA
jgi:CheY-like chemotaxis protein